MNFIQNNNYIKQEIQMYKLIKEMLKLRDQYIEYNKNEINKEFISNFSQEDIKKIKHILNN